MNPMQIKHYVYFKVNTMCNLCLQKGLPTLGVYIFRRNVLDK